jgi:hypothetical protein
MNGALKVSRAAERTADVAVVIRGREARSQQPAILGTISFDLFAVLLGGATALLFIYACNILHPSLRDVERLE